jgi:prolyl 4-hydroxylase
LFPTLDQNSDLFGSLLFLHRRQKLLSCGPRILTFFLYLSDVEEGGETVFPTLDIKVKPKRGRALIWPSVLNDNPEEQDPRTTHAAAPVIKGKKYAANAWIHLYDFAKSNLWGCTGAFDYL